MIPQQARSEIIQNGSPSALISPTSLITISRKRDRSMAMQFFFQTLLLLFTVACLAFLITTHFLIPTNNSLDSIRSKEIKERLFSALHRVSLSYLKSLFLCVMRIRKREASARYPGLQPASCRNESPFRRATENEFSDVPNAFLADFQMQSLHPRNSWF